MLFKSKLVYEIINMKNW